MAQQGNFSQWLQLVGNRIYYWHYHLGQAKAPAEMYKTYRWKYTPTADRPVCFWVIQHFKLSFVIIAKTISEWVPSSPWLAVYLSVFCGSCCRTNQAVTPQGDHSLFPPAVYIPTHSAPGLGRGRKWSHTACAYVTQYSVLEINQLRIEVTKGLWSALISCSFSVGEGSRWQDHLNVAI